MNSGSSIERLEVLILAPAHDDTPWKSLHIVLSEKDGRITERCPDGSVRKWRARPDVSGLFEFVSTHLDGMVRMENHSVGDQDCRTVVRLRFHERFVLAIESLNFGFSCGLEFTGRLEEVCKEIYETDCP